MNGIKSLFLNHIAIFTILFTAFVFDITGAMQDVMPGATFGLASLVAVLYWVGTALFIRFVAASKRIHLAITWPVIIALYFSWFLVHATLMDGEQYRPSLLFALCLVAAFKILRFQDPVNETEKYANLE